MHVCVYAQLLSHVWVFETSWMVAHQASLSVEFSRQECWSSLPFLTPGDLHNLGIKPTFLGPPALAGGFFITSATWEGLYYVNSI